MPRDPLDSVYRLIASNSYMEAIHLINKLLKKQPNFLLAKVWKCEALYGLGNVVESEELMTSIIEQAPVDRRTLDSIADFYRARGNYPKLVEVYENALKTDPNDDEWRKALFECCGLARDYKKQQQQALHLYKQQQNILYYCMAVVCLLQQADENPVALELAERMMAKQNDAGKLTTRNEILLFITVLERRRKFKEALDVLHKFRSELQGLISTSDKRIELLIKSESWTEVVSELKEKVKENPDHWTNLKNYVHAVLAMQAKNDKTEDMDEVRNAREFLKSLSKDHEKLRGPNLAIIEMASREEATSELIDLISDYFHRYATKAISVFDLNPYVTSLPKSMVPKLLDRILPNGSQLTLTEGQAQLGTLKHISYLQIIRLLGNNTGLSAGERENLCESLESCYHLAEGCERRENYLLLISHERCTLFRDTEEAKHLIKAAITLETALEKTPIFSMQVLLLQIYFALGASKSARKLYEQLRIQSVQVDTLVHLFLYSITSTGHFTIASEMWDIALKILQQCSSESLEALVWCYRAGLYHRVEEFTSCARRFQKTITVPLLKVEKAFLDLVNGEPARSEQILSRVRPGVAWDECLDNRDLAAIPTWDPPSSKISRDQSFAELKLFCKVREAILTCLSTAILYGKQRKEINDKSFRDALDNLQSLYSQAAAMISQIQNAPGRTRLPLIIQVPLPSLLEKILESDIASLEKIVSLLNRTTADTLEVVSQNRSKNPRASLEKFVTQLEALSVVTVAVGAARAGLAASHRRRSTQVLQALGTNWTALESALPVATVAEDLDGPSQQVVRDKLNESYQTATDDIRKLIKKKVTYLNKISAN